MTHQFLNNGRIKFEKTRRHGNGLWMLEVHRPIACPAFYPILTSSLTNYMDDVRYGLHKGAGAFFQCGYGEVFSDYFLIEFWTDNENAIDAYLEQLSKDYVYDWTLAFKRVQTAEELEELKKMFSTHFIRMEILEVEVPYQEKLPKDEQEEDEATS